MTDDGTLDGVDHVLWMRKWSDRLEAVRVGESERGLVLVTAAILDERLEMLLTRCFRADDSKAVTALLRGRYAPLSAFGTRIDAAYALGALRRSTRRALHSIRRIRNECAHTSGDFTLGTASIWDRCRSAQMELGLDVPTPKDIDVYFCGIVGAVLVRVSVAAEQVATRGLTAERELIEKLDRDPAAG